MKLLEEIRLQVQRDDKLIFEMAEANRVRFGSVLRWLRVNDEKLTLKHNLNLIRDHFGFEPTKIITHEAECATVID